MTEPTKRHREMALGATFPGYRPPAVLAWIETGVPKPYLPDSYQRVAQAIADLEAPLLARIEELERERDEVRDWVRKLTSEQRVLTCVYCGHEYPPGSPAHGSEVLTAHIAVCEKHPLRAAEARIAEIENKLALTELERDAGASLLFDVQQDAIAKGKRVAELEANVATAQNLLAKTSFEAGVKIGELEGTLMFRPDPHGVFEEGRAAGKVDALGVADAEPNPYPKPERT